MVEADFSHSELDPDMKDSLDALVEELIDEVSLGLCFEIHRSCKIGSFFLNGFDDTSDTEYAPLNAALVDRPGVDVLGQVPSKKNYECICPNCQRHLAASRFAPHLEKCMGMGRNSSRIASRRIANNQKQGSDESGQDDENDNDWNYSSEPKRIKRLKKDKVNNSPRNRKFSKLRNGGSSQDLASADTSENADSAPFYESMRIEERKALLLSSCGVISEHTKRMCTRTGKCVQHTDEQRRQVRQLLLRQSRAHDLEDIHIDIDTYDDAESQSLRESLQWEAASSPADSTSTNNSTTGPVNAGTSQKRKQRSTKSSKTKKSKLAKQSVSSSSSAGSNKEQSQHTLFDF
ncbi:ataxin-7-like protein 3 isoform X1 [Biomphalaria glabrata]|uniref:SAGA-associated factor 11 homolog n=1 Tax=Biomphalaria glabrata TaxID=6526 RepID=A0A9W2YAK3_BIOGL|nr:ataxin-7-like protein 3 isoform X1 [Biomphalaria glabrata]XP_055859771.1 ataxin-7-like protein 3 isoform X1 [Biomphalaria glabrata]XP_055859772.1 ataxin-7-like protein 3 isoform X1 [Biomphalaria glabrata]XP_055859773.1 ataxin-7-like protein 3 isoform X1 [Biomphalaria glabrata]XP_055859774.1 ataxin-7-like protein 3 isoform X1 [Biomphalaria glabrata]